MSATAAAGFLTAWAAGASLLVAAETLLLPDLPRPPAGDLVRAAVGGALDFLPIGAPIAALLGFAVWLGSRAGVADRVAAALWALPIAALALPGGLLTAAIGAPSRSTAVGLTAAGLAASIALGVAGWARRRALGRPIIVLAALSCPLWLAALAGALPFANVPGRPLPSAGGLRVVILGIDGATWDVMRPMIERGELPNISALMERGAHGPLRSLEPTLSNRVWTSAATGVVPERHGVTDFFYDRRFIRVPTIWDLVDREDGRVGLFEYLVTDPPAPYNGFVLPGWMAQNPAETHPPNLTRRLRALSSLHHPYTVARYLMKRGGRDRRKSIREFVIPKLSATAFLALHHRYSPDLSACVWYGTDRLGHSMWRYYQPEAFSEAPATDGGRFRDVLPRVYRAADAQIGRVVRSLDDGRTLFIVMSDHGMGPMERPETLGFVRGRRALELLSLGDQFYVANPHQETFVNARLDGRRPDPTVSAVEHAALVETAAGRFAEARREDTGEPLFVVAVADMDTVDLKVRVADAEALEPDTPVRVGGRRVPASDVIQLVEVSGTHRIDGVLVLSGPGVRPGVTLRDAVITDIAPTVLQALGLPIAEDLDGRALLDAFDDEWRRVHSARVVRSFGTIDSAASTPIEPSEEVIERLRSLGYIR
jgi:predicted AlkP superfamily phosphohydrolase/phosphomutase